MLNHEPFHMHLTIHLKIRYFFCIYTLYQLDNFYIKIIHVYNNKKLKIIRHKKYQNKVKHNIKYSKYT